MATMLYLAPTLTLLSKRSLSQVWSLQSPIRSFSQALKANTVYVNLPEKRLFFYDQNEQKLYVLITHPQLAKCISQKRYKPIWNVPKVYLPRHMLMATLTIQKKCRWTNNSLGDYAFIYLRKHI